MNKGQTTFFGEQAASDKQIVEKWKWKRHEFGRKRQLKDKQKQKQNKK